MVAGATNGIALAVIAFFPSRTALWSQLFSANLHTTIIAPDHTFAMVQEASNQHVDLATYLRRSSKPEHENLRQLEKILPAFSIRRYTTFDGVSTAVRVSQLAEQFGGRVVVRYARDMTLRELSPGHVVLIGRPLSNLWNEMFENKLNRSEERRVGKERRHRWGRYMAKKHNQCQ